MNRLFTFRSKLPFVSIFLRCLVVMLVSYCTNVIVLFSTGYYLGFGNYISQTLAVVSYLCVGFFGNSLFVFKEDEQEAK
ncbi:GtrA family protein [Mesorhizobium sp. ORM6]